MALTLYRRHRLECEAEHPEDSRSGEWEERRRGWKRCNCGIHLSGTLGGKFSRKAAGTAEWLEARRLAEAYESANSWTGTLGVQPPAPDPTPEKPRITIEDACTAFRVSRQSAGLAPATLNKYRTFTTQVTAYADSRGYAMIDQITLVDITCSGPTGSLAHAPKASV